MFFLPSLGGGGAEKIIVRLANHFANSGLTVDLCAATATGVNLDWVSSDIKIIDFKHPRVIRSLIPLIKYLRKNKPAVVYTTMMHANIIVAIACRLSGIKTRLVLREAVSVRKMETSSKPAQLLFNTLVRLTYPIADQIISVSDGVQEDLLAYIGKHDPDSFQIIYNPTDPEIHEKSQQPLPALPAQFTTKKFAVAVGRLSGQKDFETLIKAIGQVQKHHDLGLIILGEGGKRKHLEQLAQSLGVTQLHMPGYVDNIYPYIKAASVFVLSSRYEGMPNALIEALALGSSIVATRCPSGPEEVLEHGRLGELVDVGDDKAMAEAIIKQITQSSDVANDTRGLARFSLDQIARQYASIGNLKI